ncbi:hypothetical protein EXS70_02930 [Candidatus Peribacteria bacterium]|nr:hypothetical protein [Candidatus Peribacteria bacterium]
MRGDAWQKTCILKPMPLYIRLFLRFILTLLLVWAMAVYMDQYFFVTGGLLAYVIIAALITLMNILISPLLNLILLPLRMLATIVAIVLANGLFLFFTVWVIDHMERDLVTVDIQGGLAGWILVAIVLGMAKWLMKICLK